MRLGLGNVELGGECGLCYRQEGGGNLSPGPNWEDKGVVHPNHKGKSMVHVEYRKEGVVQVD